MWWWGSSSPGCRLGGVIGDDLLHCLDVNAIGVGDDAARQQLLAVVPDVRNALGRANFPLLLVADPFGKLFVDRDIKCLASIAWDSFPLKMDPKECLRQAKCDKGH